MHEFDNVGTEESDLLPLVTRDDVAFAIVSCFFLVANVSALLALLA